MAKIALMVSPNEYDHARNELQRLDYIVIDDSNYTLDQIYLTEDTKSKTDINWERLTYTGEKAYLKTYKRHCDLLDKADLVCFTYKVNEFSWRHWHDVIYTLLSGKSVCLSDGYYADEIFNFKKLQKLIKKNPKYQIFMDCLNWAMRVGQILAFGQLDHVTHSYNVNLDDYAYLKCKSIDINGAENTVDPWWDIEHRPTSEIFDISDIDLKEYPINRVFGVKNIAKFVSELLACHLDKLEFVDLVVDKAVYGYDPRFLHVDRFSLDR